MRNKDFENFMKTGNIIDYLNYKKKSNGEKDGAKRGDCRQGNKLSR